MSEFLLWLTIIYLMFVLVAPGSLIGMCVTYHMVTGVGAIQLTLPARHDDQDSNEKSVYVKDAGCAEFNDQWVMFRPR